MAQPLAKGIKRNPTVQMTCRPEDKARIDRQAWLDGRNTSNWLALVVLREVDRLEMAEHQKRNGKEEVAL